MERKPAPGRGFGTIIALDLLMAPGYLLFAGFSGDALRPNEPLPWPTLMLLALGVAGIVCPIVALVGDRLKAPEALVVGAAVLPVVATIVLMAGAVAVGIARMLGWT